MSGLLKELLAEAQKREGVETVGCVDATERAPAELHLWMRDGRRLVAPAGAGTAEELRDALDLLLPETPA